jgi:hypothetical protein
VTINLDEEGILINLDGKLSTKGDTIPRKKYTRSMESVHDARKKKKR